ncbi:hypothetical protein JJL56_06240 [Azospirillum sp. YIM DDC1]|uniref:DUF4398 domain-containing protein n=1 Tax=Azospirillum aestuarii TaxID=2802052 RepID=A0ABS1HUF3_9PROT|nr:hypothetical protein [Azospirillum aestuarii]MBK4718462.1 hypothetical protein [Azospirillum aestuarii]
MIGRTRAIFLAGGLTLLLSGCVSTYIDQKADLRAGGPQAREAAARQQYVSAKAQNTDLNDQLVSTQRDIDRNERRIAAAQTQLSTVRQDLDRARRSKKLSESEYRRMRAEADDLNRDITELDFKMKAGGVSTPADAADKDRQIQALEKKKAELEKAIQLTLGQ